MNIVYNKLDLPIMTQDSVQRTGGEWLFTKYDAFGRTAYTGKATDSRPRDMIQNEVNGLTSDLWVVRAATSTNFGGADVYYDNGAYPNSGSTTVLSEVLTIDYYDDYGFLDGETGMALPADVFGKNIENHDNTDKLKTKGLATGSRVKVLDTDDWITTVTGYDHKGRSIYTASRNGYLETMDVTGSKLDFTGRPLKIRASHTRNNITIVTLDNFVYDHVGRLLSQTQCIGDENMGDSCPASQDLEASLPVSGTVDGLREATQSITVTDATLLPGAHLRISNGSEEELIVYNEYDGLGQLVQKKVGGVPGTDYGTTHGLQTIDYRYNVRGWLTNINEDGDNGDNDLFDLVLRYDDPLDGTPLYNGNIGQSSWHTQNLDPSVKTYTYFYDPLNRITSATDNTGNYSVSNITYDKNGNIQALTRNGFQGGSTFTDMDVLDYGYDNGNKLLKVSDTGNKLHGFIDGANINDDFDYDANGNLVLDRNKGITDIEYNYLNLPTKITVNGNGNVGNIVYIYDATGTKLKKVATEGSSVTETDYSDNYIYENDVLRQFSHPEGYVEPDGQGGYDYVYAYKDHLGTVRLTYSDFNGNGSIEPATEILQERNTYPFGLEHKGYNNVQNGAESNYQTYLGQEMNKELGLNWLTFRYRNYDPTIGRFFGVDPITEEYHYISPYQFASNNPVWKVEIEGLEGEETSGMDLIRQGFANIWNAITGGVESTENGMRRRSAQSRATQLARGGNMVAEGAATKEVGHAVLDAAGTVDPTPITDTGHAIWYAAEGEYGNAALTAAGVIPLYGDSFKSLKYAKYGDGLAAIASGNWVRTGESMSAAAASFQKQITGIGAGESFKLNGVKFDGATANGILLDAKSGMKNFVAKDGNFRKWFKGADGLVKQANRQLDAANGAKIQWHFENKSVMDATQNLFKKNDIQGIDLIYTPRQ